MHVIVNGLGKNGNGYSFAFGLLGVSPIFQSNQIVEVFNSVILKDQFLFNDKFSIYWEYF